MRVLVFAAAVVGAGCASSGSAPVQQAASADADASTSAAMTSARCVPIMSDTLVAGVLVYPECGVVTKARMTGTPPRLQYTPSSNCARAVIDFVVDANGNPHPATVRIIRVTDQSLATALVSQLPGLRFTPAMKDGQKVAQLYRLDFVMQAVRVTAATRGAVRPSRAVTC
jgi:hypothetical protein